MRGLERAAATAEAVAEVQGPDLHASRRDGVDDVAVADIKAHMIDGTATGIENEVACHKAVGSHEVAFACDDTVLHTRLVVERVAAGSVRGARKA